MVWKEQQEELEELGFTVEDLQYSFTMVRTWRIRAGQWGIGALT
jgi:hypothetical protein